VRTLAGEREIRAVSDPEKNPERRIRKIRRYIDELGSIRVDSL